MIYLDSAATVPATPAALETFIEITKKYYGNASSLHSLGNIAARKLSEARLAIAKAIGAQPNEIYFTSGATESNNWALESLAQTSLLKEKTEIISSSFEHHSILNKLHNLESRGFKVRYVDPQKNGIIDVGDIEKNITDKTGFISIMSLNNEVGTLQPLNEIEKLCSNNKIYLHTDATQYLPHYKMKLKKHKINMLSFSAHKFGGLKGTGALYVKQKTPLNTLLFGGKQEKTMRGGTENVAGICAMATALNENIERLSLPFCTEQLKEKRDAILSKLRMIDGFHLNTDASIPNIINFYIENISSETLFYTLNSQGIYLSTTSACASGSSAPSHVLSAMGLSKEAVNNSLRISFDSAIELNELLRAGDTIIKAVDYLRKT